jgi:hypothetical protein
MRDVLVAEFSVPDPIVLYDRPRQMLPVVPISSRSAGASRAVARAGFVLPEGSALAVCPTSWTADEDMALLLEGLMQWDAAPPGPRLFVLITGRGPLRDAFERRLSGIRWRRAEVHTAFLDPADYRELLCAAHFGFCMHRSSSGVDLPMKVMDLFGARTPVCALDYGACLAEQLQPGVHGGFVPEQRRTGAPNRRASAGIPRRYVSSRAAAERHRNVVRGDLGTGVATRRRSGVPPPLRRRRRRPRLTLETPDFFRSPA